MMGYEPESHVLLPGLRGYVGVSFPRLLSLGPENPEAKGSWSGEMKDPQSPEEGNFPLMRN